MLSVGFSFVISSTTLKNISHRLISFNDKFSVNGSSDQGGSDYLQAFAKYLKEEYMNKSVTEIFIMVDKLMEVRSRRVIGVTLSKI